MQSEHVLRTEIKPTPYQKLFELVTSTECCIMDFTGANNQLSFFATSLVYDKSNQHRGMYNSYNTELVSTKIKSMTFENVSNTYSTFNSVKFNTSDPQFVVWYCKGCSIALLSDYTNNPVFQELRTRS